MVIGAVVTVVDAGVDKAEKLVSATLACGFDVTATDAMVSVAELMAENCKTEEDGDVVALAGGATIAGVAVVACTWGDSSTCASEIEVDVDLDVDADCADAGEEYEEEDELEEEDEEVDGLDEEEEADVLVLVAACALGTSVLGTAVHLFPPSVVMKAPTGRLGFVGMMM